MTAPRVERIEDLETALLAVLQGHQATVWTALPAQVTSVNLTRMTVECQVTVQARIKQPDLSYVWVTMPPLVDVPIVFPQGGGYILTFPIAVGDEVLVILASRCIDGWWQSGGVQIPPDFRMHDLSDGFALVGPRSQARLVGSINPSAVELRNESGGTRVAIQSNGNVTIDAPQVNITGDVHITGALTNNGKNVGSTHLHSSVKSGSDTSGAPV